MQVNTVEMSAAVEFGTPPVLEMYVAPFCKVVLVQFPRAVYWKIPCFPPVESQPAMLPSPAPISDEITPTWMLGSPPGSPLSTSMNIGKFVSRFACDMRIDDES